MEAAVPATSSIASDPAPLGRALAGALLTLATAGLAISFLGLILDHAWHNTRPFDRFWSPPHIVLYSGLGMVLVSNLGLFSRPVREAMGGPMVAAWPLAFRVPAPLLITALGSLVALFSGMVDQKWHEVLKGGESLYSLPHNSILLGAVVAALGVLAGAHSFRGRREPRAWEVAVLASGLMIPFVRLVSSFADSRAFVAAGIADPVLSTDIGATQMRMRYLELNLLTDNTLLAPLALVLALLVPAAFASALAKKGWAATRAAVAFAVSLLVLTAMVRALGLNILWSSPALFLVVPAAFAADLAGPRLGSRPWLAWALAGTVFAAGHDILYGFSAPGIALAAAGGALAGLAGRGLGRLVENPTPRAVGLVILLVGVAVPVGLGGLDTYLRYGTFYGLVL